MVKTDTEKKRLQSELAQLPAVDELLHEALRREFMPRFPRPLVTEHIRKLLEVVKQRVLRENFKVKASFPDEGFWRELDEILTEFLAPALKKVINASGVVIHTNLGRSPLPAAAVEQIAAVAGGYSNLEYDLSTGSRSIRYVNVESLLCRLCGTEAAMVVNNNAGAVLLALSALAAGREVVVSRGELVEIGGAFRIPEIVTQGGAVLREVGATNRTHLRDYEAAINEETALLLKVHTSNYRIAGFTYQPEMRELVALGQKYDLPVIEDLGSGNLLDLKAFGLTGEPTVSEIMANGVALATFSGDKLLGGPQAGIIVGRKELVEKLKKHPLNRALRIDKMTLAGLEAVLKFYLDPAVVTEKIPTLRMLTVGSNELKKQAQKLHRVVKRACLGSEKVQLQVAPSVSRAGGGAMPMVELATFALFLRVQGESSARLEKYLRARSRPIVVRIIDDWLVFDPRTIFADEFAEIGRACQEMLLL
ncbi:MAG: L-seryl-tRNA(Sec) selenium transferase [Deltaproteobacteria bacterium]|nr:L-seryl-tRNA(Sec) selenium transferase [Candidatus Tharpella sp.]